MEIELFRQYGGKLGYYLADLRNKKCDYCGWTEEDVRGKLYELGIAIEDF